MTRFRELLYKGGTAFFSVLAVLSTFHIIDPVKSAALSYGVTSLLSLFGVTIAGTAAYNITKQRKEGVFTPTAPPPPENQIIDGLTKLQEQKNQLDAAVGTVASALSKTTNDIPVLGPLAKQVLDQIVR